MLSQDEPLNYFLPDNFGTFENIVFNEASMPHENESHQGAQTPEEEWRPDPGFLRFRQIVSSWSEPAYEAVATLSSILLEGDVEQRIKAHDEHGDFERRVLVDEFRKVNMKNRQIRFVFRHFGLKVPKDGLKRM